ncbi:MAG: NAD-dependent epimerase/dehydratase family protein [Candidatus Levyibacteriota bacterium]
MNILITGGAGFIGSSLIEALLKKGEKVCVVDNFNSYYNPKFKKENIKNLLAKKKLKVVKVDILEKDVLKQLFAKEKFNKIIHIAASVGIRNSLMFPNQYSKNNIDGTEQMLKFAVQFGVDHFIFASSSSIYGNNSSTPFTENEVIASKLNPYAHSKKAAEEHCETYHKKYGIPITIFRFFTVYGPKGRPDMAPYIFTESILNEKKIKVFGDGSAQRDFTYIDDIVRGIILGLEKKFPFEIFNLGNSSPVNILNFIKIIEKITGKKANLEFISPIPSEMKNTYANIRKAEKLLGYKPKTSIEEGLEAFIKWYKENRMHR